VNSPHKVYQGTPSSYQIVSAAMGRATKPFVESSRKNKKRKIKSLLHAMNSKAITPKEVYDICTYTFGLSTLQAWIRFFERLLHYISYRLDIKTWQIRGKGDKDEFEIEKEIKDRFKEEVGLLVDYLNLAVELQTTEV
jgi:hypothetical protein